MTDPLLSYQTPVPVAQSRIVVVTWIYLLILGILGCGFGACVGSSMFLESGTGHVSTRAGWLIPLLGLAYLLFGCGTGILYIWSALCLRRGSRTATVTAMVTSLVVAGLVVVMVGAGTVNIMRHIARTDVVVLILVVVFYLVIAAANAAAAYLLHRVLRLMRQTHTPS